MTILELVIGNVSGDSMPDRWFLCDLLLQSNKMCPYEVQRLYYNLERSLCYTPEKGIRYSNRKIFFSYYGPVDLSSETKKLKLVMTYKWIKVSVIT